MTNKSYAAAMMDALAFSLAEDALMTVIGRGLTGHGSEHGAEKPIHEKYGRRVIDPPTSESVVVSIGTGCAMSGVRAYVHLDTASFAFEAVNQLVNEAANVYFMSGGQTTAPVVFHMFHGIRGGGAPQHSHSPQSMYANCPGLEIVMPASAADAKGLMRRAIKSNNPTIVFTHNKLLALKGEVPDGDYDIPFGKADIKRAGRDVSVIATSIMVQEALKAADILAAEGIEIEVVDPRTIVPLDREGICASVRRTGRAVVADEGNLTCSVASEIAASIAEGAFKALKAPILRVARPDMPVAYAPPLESFVTPDATKIVEAVRRIMRG